MLLAALLAGCAAPPGLRDDGASAPPVFTRLELGGVALDAEWHLPRAEPAAWLLLQHGFARRCANLRGTAARLAADAGVATLCVNADMAGGAPALAAALAGWLASPDARAPDGRAAPAPLIVGGHSAGGLFAARVGAELAHTQPQRLAGALLLDPVGGPALAQALAAVSAQGRRPVLAVVAPPSPCNAGQLGAATLRGVQAAARAAGRDGFIGVELAGGTHLDAEGGDSEALAVRACREGWPKPENVAALRALAVHWAAALAAAPDRPPGAASSAAALSATAASAAARWRVIE
ncbi:MAG: alpha/beta hydrolase [Rubrivivax sp.]|nr:alpha/beta hydrolase [Rubrivivax sp.]